MSTAPLPLTAGQEALWLLYRLAPESTAYHVLVAVRIRGALDVSTLDTAVSALAGRHDVAGCRFLESRGVPGWVPAAPGTPGGVRLDVREVPATTTDEELHALAAAAYREPFRLTDEPPLRVVLLRRGPRDAVLLLVAHHLATDATSQWILLRDLLAAYRGLRRAGTPDWAPLAWTYRDHVEEERRLLASAERRELAAFWADACAGAEPGTLRTDRPRPPVPAMVGGTVEWRLPDELSAALRQQAARSRVTPFALLLATFQALVHRGGGQTEFLVGCPAATRHRRPSRDVVGHLVNNLPLRAALDGPATLREAAVLAHHRLGRALAHARYPAVLVPARAGTVRTALTMVGGARLDPPLEMPVTGVEGPTLGWDGLELAVLDLPQQEGQLDLLVELVRVGPTLRARFRYDAELFRADTAHQLAADFAALARVAAHDPDRKIGDDLGIEAAVPSSL